MLSTQSESNISLTNPYEKLIAFMQDVEDQPRMISEEEIEDLRTMYEDLIEISTRYDDLKVERHKILILLQEYFLKIPELCDIFGITRDCALSS